MRWAGHVVPIRKRRGAYRGLVGKREVKCPVESHRRRRKDNIRIDLQEMGWWAVDWIDLAWDRDKWRAVVNAVMNLRV
jgi:hypothetical protein